YMILLTSSLLILLIIGLRKLAWKKLSPIFRYSLWLLVAVRLLLPLQLGSSVLSIENIFPEKAQVQEEIQIPVPSIAPTEQAQDPLPTEQIMSEGILPTEEIILQEVKPADPTPIETQIPDTPTATPNLSVEETQKSRFFISAKQILHLIRILGSVTMAVWYLYVNIRFQKAAMKDATAVEAPQIPLPVYESRNIPSPCMVGLLRPRIFLLPGDDPTSRTHILTHEYTHYRHRDHIWSFIRVLCLCIHWYNPLVWIAAYLSREDCEMACDYSAVNILGDNERFSYGRTLVDTVQKAGRPDSLLRSATTMGGGMGQMRRRVNCISQKHKKALWVAVCILIVLALAVGCTFTGGKTPAQAPEESSAESTETTAPTEETVLDATVESEETESPTENPYAFLPYGNTTVVTDYEAEGYAIPKLLLDTPHGEDINKQIQERFGKIAQGDRSQYSSLSYDWYINTLEEEFLDDHYILTLEIRVTYSRGGIEECFYYNVDLATGEEPYDMSFYSELQYHVAQTLAFELMTQYADTGSLSFTQEDLLRFRRNLDRIGEDSIAWYRKDGNVQATYLYEPMGSSSLIEVHVDDLLSGFYPNVSLALQKAEVVKLYTYIDELGAENTIPFILAPGNRVLNTNATILLRYLEPQRNHVTYSWAVNGDILSFAIQGDETEHFGYVCLAENFFLKDATDRIPSMEEVLAQAKVPMTVGEYKEQAKVAFRSYFFDLFPEITEQFPDDKMVSSVVYKCGTNANIENSKPYLDRDGNVWAMGKIYQIAGSESTINLIPISTGKVNEEYLAFAEENNLFQGSEQVLQKYLKTLYGGKNYDLIYSAENAYPEYADDKIHAEGLDDHVIVRISRELDPTMTEADIEAIPELKAACEMLGVDKIEYFTNTSSPANIREMYVMDSTLLLFTGPIDRYVKVVWDSANKEVHILIYWG
ncbi:MAG: M56 family metallopeptidase, partial [Oscillospiraceae bacterium]|nr:M56 family metallopeptidase [Oscillospiraceae bacterium]